MDLCQFAVDPNAKVLGADGTTPVATSCGLYSCVNVPGGFTTTPVSSTSTGTGSSTGGTNASPGSGTGTGQIPVDAPPAMDGDYVNPTFPMNPEGLCMSNGVGSTCTNTQMPSIACCTDQKSGAFFNACCVSGFAGIQTGDQDGDGNANEFDVAIRGYGTADCVINPNGTGCAVLAVPGNEPATPVNYPPSVGGPCVQVAPNTPCASHGGTCSSQATGNTFDVCCPTCATGTYQIGDSCSVTLPDPAACGYNIVGGGGGGASAPTPAAVVPAVPVPAVTSQGDGNNDGVRPAASSGSVGTGGTCSSSQDCIQTSYCASNNVCVSMGTCQRDSDCSNANNEHRQNSCPGTVSCLGVICVKNCDPTGGSSSGGSSSSSSSTSGGVPAFTGTTTMQGNQSCPTTAASANGKNCCSFLPRAEGGVADEASCMYQTSSGATQCDCPGQLDDEGYSYCETIGWNCRNLSQGPNSSVNINQFSF